MRVAASGTVFANTPRADRAVLDAVASVSSGTTRPFANATSARARAQHVAAAVSVPVAAIMSS